MSALVGKPVRLQLMRWDENGWGHYGPALLADVRGAVDANGNLVAIEYTAFGIPYFTTNHTQQQVDRDGAVRDDRRARHDDQRRAVQHPEPPGDRRRRCRSGQLLQVDVPARAERESGGVRRRAADRRARLRGEDGPGRVPAQEHRDADEPDSGRGAALEERARGRGRGSRSGSRGWRRRTCRTPTSSRAAASRSALLEHARRRRSPTSR